MKKIELNDHLLSTNDAGRTAIRAIAAARVFIRKTGAKTIHLYGADIVAVKCALNESGHNTSGGLTISGATILNADCTAKP